MRSSSLDSSLSALSLKLRCVFVWKHWREMRYHCSGKRPKLHRLEHTRAQIGKEKETQNALNPQISKMFQCWAIAVRQIALRKIASLNSFPLKRRYRCQMYSDGGLCLSCLMLFSRHPAMSGALESSSPGLCIQFGWVLGVRWTKKIKQSNYTGLPNDHLVDYTFMHPTDYKI